MDEGSGQQDHVTDDQVDIQNYDDQFNAFDYVQWCYEQDGIPLEILEDVWPTVEFLISTATYDSRLDDNNPYLYYDQQQEPQYDDYFQADANQFDVCDSENVSDEENEDEEKEEVASTSESDNQNDELQLSDRLDIDCVLEDELKRLNLSRQTRRRNRRKYNLDKNALFLSGLVQQMKVAQPMNAFLMDNEKTFQTEFDPIQCNSFFTECFNALSRVSDMIPETNDDLDDYRLAASMYVNAKLLESNKELSWKVDSLGKCLKRSLNELCLFRLALQNTVGDLKMEIELLRNNTLSTIKRIIKGDITRRQKIQEQWDDVQTFIRRKNRRIAELTEQLNGADLEVGFLLASHKERIESAAFAERNFFRASERLEDLELELKKKRCNHCESNQESTAQEQIEQAEIQKRREEKRKEFEATEKQQFAHAERYGKVIQNLVSTYQDSKNSNLPWHDNPEKQPQNGQPIPVLNNGVAQPSASTQNLVPTEYRPGFVPFEVYQLTRYRCEEMERESKKQERMNEILSRDLTDSKSNITKLKNENMDLKDENKKLLSEINKLKTIYHRKNGKLNSTEILTPDSNSSDKSKDEFLPKPPTPPELALRAAKNSPSPAELLTVNKRKLVNENNDSPRNAAKNSIKNEFSNHSIKPTSTRTEEFFPNDRRLPINDQQRSIERRYFSPPQRVRRSVSPEAKRPALGFMPPPSLMPPQRNAPTYYKDLCRADQGPSMRDNRQFYDDAPSTFRSFSPPDCHRRDVSPPSPQFEPMRRGPPINIPVGRPMPPMNSWQRPTRPMQSLLHARPMYGPSLLPPRLSPTPSENRPMPMQRPHEARPHLIQRPLPPWHGNGNGPPMMRPQVRTTSWINNGSSFRR